MPPRTTRKSYRPRVSDRTMVGTAQPLCLFACGTERRRHRNSMNLRRRQIHSASLRYLGWTARRFSQRLPVAGESFLLTSPFIERRYRTYTGLVLRRAYFTDSVTEGFFYHGSGPSSLKTPAVGPSSGSSARRTGVAAPCSTVLVPRC